MTGEPSSVFLGPEVEAEYRRVQKAVTLEHRFGVAMWTIEIGSLRDFDDLVIELETRLGSVTMVERVHEGEESAAEQVRQISVRGKGRVEQGLPIPVALVALRDPGSAESIRTLVSLNVRRDFLFELAPVFVVVLGFGGDFTLAPDLGSVAMGPFFLRAEVRMQKKTGPIGFVHISDFHVNERDWTQEVVFDALVRDLPDLLKGRDVIPHLIFATGDFAYSGKPSEFRAAQNLLHKLQSSVAPLVPLDERTYDGNELSRPIEYLAPKLFVVPGNHDVDRSKKQRFEKQGLDELLATSSWDLANHRLGDWWQEATKRENAKIEEAGTAVELASGKLSAFYQFTSDVLGSSRSFDPAVAWRVDRYEFRGVSFGVVCLNSAWSCTQADARGRILIGEHQVRQALKELKAIGDADVKVGLIHHPPAWWPEFEEQNLSDLIRVEFDILLTGHEHSTRNISEVAGERRLIHLAAGAAHAGRQGVHGCHAGSIDPYTGAVSIFPFEYSHRDGGFWAPDHKQQRGSNGSIPFSLGRALARRSSANSASSVAPGRTASMFRRLCRAQELHLRQVSFLGIPATAVGRRRADLIDTYVPLELSRERGKQLLPTQQLVESLLAFRPVSLVSDPSLPAELGLAGLDSRENASIVGGMPARRVVVLGDPGAGKTTLIRYLAWSIAGAPEPKLPVILTLRDWIAAGAQSRLLDFAASEMSRVLQQDVDGTWLTQLADEGSAVLLVDGFDEVAAESQRTDIRDMVASLAHAYPRMSVVATSRVLGYDKAPLPKEFRTFTLKPFTDDQLERFVKQWYETQFLAGEWREKNQAIAGLLGALNAEPRARELARNPLFATLIAMVHHSEARLPSERAKLYAKIVEMMLETWPATSGRQFRDARLSPTRQRKLLQRLAFRIQCDREMASVAGSDDRRTSGEVEFDRKWCERRQAEWLIEMFGSAAEDLDELAHKFLKHQLVQTGVLVETAPGRISFFHLSVLEYLAGLEAARVWGEKGNAHLTEQILTRITMPNWRESLLLLLGSVEGQRELMEQLVHLIHRGTTHASTPDPGKKGAFRFTKAGDPPELTVVQSRWHFCLQALGEDVDCAPNEISRILDAAGAHLTGDERRAKVTRQFIEDLKRFSRLHGAVVDGWATKTWSEGTGQRLGNAVEIATTVPWRLVASRDDHLWRLCGGSLQGGAVAGILSARPDLAADAPPFGHVTNSIAVGSRRHGALEALLERDAAALLFKGIANAPFPQVVPGIKHQQSSVWPQGRGICLRSSITANTRARGYRAAYFCHHAHSSGGPEPHIEDPLAQLVYRMLVVRFPWDANQQPIVSVLLGTSEPWWRVLLTEVASFLRIEGIGSRTSDVYSFLPNWSAIGDEPASLPACYLSDRRVQNGGDKYVIRDIVHRVGSECVIGAFTGLTPSGWDEGRAQDSVFDRVASLWHGLFHDPISRLLVEQHGDTTKTRATLGASALFTYNYHGVWPESDWLQDWRAGGEPEDWQEAYIWHLVRAFDNPDDPSLLEVAQAALERAPADEDSQEVARFLKALAVRPYTAAERSKLEDDLRENWLNFVRKYGYMGWEDSTCWKLPEGEVPGNEPFPNAPEDEG